MNESILFYAVLIISFIVNLIIYLLTKEATFCYKKNLTDSEKNLKATLISRLFSNLSHVHNIKYARSQCREVHFFFTKLFNRLFFKNIVEEKVNISLNLFANFISAIFFFLFFENFFNESIAFFLSLIFIFSTWHYQISIYWGHIILSTMWFLISIYLTTLLSSDSSLTLKLTVSFFVGLTCSISYFSSSASRKYPAIVFFLFLLSLYKSNEITFLYSNQKILITFIIFLFFFIFIKKINDFFISFTKVFCNNLLKKKLNKKINIKLFLKLTKLLLFIFIIFTFFLLNTNFSINLYYLIFIFFFSFLFFCIVVFYPNIIENIHRHLSLLDIGIWANHFNSYPKNYFKKYRINKHFRGGSGLVWLPNFFLAICPVVSILFLFSFIFLISNLLEDKVYIFFLILISTSALLITEYSRMIRVSKAYYPVFFGFFFGIGSALDFYISKNIQYTYLFFIIGIIILTLHIIIESYKFFNDILPSRMFQINLKNFLVKNKIYKFSTFDSSFLDGSITPMLDKFKIFKVNYVKKIKNAKTNFFVCPPLTSKSLSLETDREAILYGDLVNDTQIKYMINKNLLDIKSIKNFKTFASSKIFPLESEVVSFRLLCYKDIKKFDRWLGLARIFRLKEGKII